MTRSDVSTSRIYTLRGSELKSGSPPRACLPFSPKFTGGKVGSLSRLSRQSRLSRLRDQSPTPRRSRLIGQFTFTRGALLRTSISASTPQPNNNGLEIYGVVRLHRTPFAVNNGRYFLDLAPRCPWPTIGTNENKSLASCPNSRATSRATRTLPLVHTTYSSLTYHAHSEPSISIMTSVLRCRPPLGPAGRRHPRVGTDPMGAYCHRMFLFRFTGLCGNFRYKSVNLRGTRKTEIGYEGSPEWNEYQSMFRTAHPISCKSPHEQKTIPNGVGRLKRRCPRDLLAEYQLLIKPGSVANERLRHHTFFQRIYLKMNSGPHRQITGNISKQDKTLYHLPSVLSTLAKGTLTNTRNSVGERRWAATELRRSFRLADADDGHVTVRT
ncbi:hypothetical protein AAG570_014090 [Ranatra chinensis]|uniref:Uncharacterized protein n=1 Tax=Ranatra chinensis TaxID=642074 RepID=A0ABD0XS23_9HEMI